MNIILMALSFVTTIIFNVLDPSYVEKMKSTIRELESAKTVADYKSASNTFERISKMEQQEWLPLYYSANIHISLVYIDTAATMAEKDQYFDYADGLITRMEKLAPKETEIQALKAVLILGRIALDPQQRGASLYGGYIETITKASAYGPENPRVKYLKLAKEVGEAKYFGKSVAPFCPQIKKLIETWETYPVVSEIHPKWGKQQLQILMKDCE